MSFLFPSSWKVIGHGKAGRDPSGDEHRHRYNQTKIIQGRP